MPTASTARLLAAGIDAAGSGQADRSSSRGTAALFKDSPLLAGKVSAAAHASRASSHAAAAGRMQAARAGAGSLAGVASSSSSSSSSSASSLSAKWAAAAAAPSTAALQHSGAVCGVGSHRSGSSSTSSPPISSPKASASGRHPNIAGLLAKTQGPAAAFDSIASRIKTTTPAAKRSASVPRSSSSSHAAAGFDAAQGSTNSSSYSSSHSSRIPGATPGLGQAGAAAVGSSSAASRPRSTSTGRGLWGALSSPGAVPAAGSAYRRSSSGSISGSNIQTAVPGRARPVGSGSSSSSSGGSSVRGGSSRTASGDLAAAANSSGASGLQSGLSATAAQQGRRAVACTLQPQLQQQPVSHNLPAAAASSASWLRVPAAAARPPQLAGSTHGSTSAAAAATDGSGEPQAAPAFDYLARLQRAVTADAVSHSSSAGWRVNSASSSSSGCGDKQHALELLRERRIRARAAAWGEAAVPSAAAAADPAPPPLAAPPAAQTASVRHALSSRGLMQAAAASQDLDNSLASLTALLDRVKFTKQQLREQELCQQQNPDTPVHIHGRRAAQGEETGPGERLEFPDLPPQQEQRPPVMRSNSGSYLDITRSSGGAAQQQQQQQQRLQPPPLTQQSALQQEPVMRAHTHGQQLLQQLMQQQHSVSKQPPQQQYQPPLQPYQPGVLRQPSSQSTSSADTAAGAPAACSLGCSDSTQVYRPPYAPPQPAGGAAGLVDNNSHNSSQHDSSSSRRLHTASVLQPAAGAAAADSWCSVGAGGTRSRTSSSGHGSIDTNTNSAASCLRQPEVQAAAAAGAVGQQLQQGFVIGTEPALHHSWDAAGQLHHASAAAAPAAAGLDQAAAVAALDAAARRAFLDCSAASSSCGSEIEPPAAAAAPLAPGRLAAHAAGRVRVDSSGAALEAGTGRHRMQPDSNVDATSPSASDVSEMSSSLDGSDSDSSISVAVRARAPPSSFTAVAAPPQHHPLQQAGSTGTAAQQVPALFSSSSSLPGSSQRHVSRSSMVGSPCSIPEGAAAAAGPGQSPVRAYPCSSLLSRRATAGAAAAAAASLLPRGCCGIRNQGNTCYQNSGVQLLACVPELVGALLGPQALPLLQGAAVEAAHRHLGHSVRQALLSAVAAAQDGIDWRPDATVGPALQALVCEMWGFQQHHHHHQQQQQQLTCRQQQQQQQQLLQRVTACMDALRSAMAESDPHWDDGGQWDCQEFSLALLQLVHNESNRVRGRPQYRELKLQGCEAQQAAEAAAYARSWEDSVVLDIFCWQLQSTMTCCTCGLRSHAFDSSQELLVAIPPGSDDVSVQECLERTLFSPEEMRGEDGFKCERCRALREATKQLQLFTYPQVLLLGLKRFETRGGSKGGSRPCDTLPYTSRKVLTRVRVEAGREGALDLSGFCNPAGLAAAAAAGRPPPRYELIAVADHTGFIHGGHYTAQGRCVLDGSWVEFNDSLVMGVEPPAGGSSAAYMLLYRLISS